jgi:hypothetical protein
MGDDPAATDGEETNSEADARATTDGDAGAEIEGDTAASVDAGTEAPPETASERRPPTETNGATTPDRSGATDDDASEPGGPTNADHGAGESTDGSVTDAESETAADEDAREGAEGDVDGTIGDEDESEPDATDEETSNTDRPPEDVRKYERFKKVDGAQYDRVNDFLRERTYITAREWAIARLCADFRTETGVEMTKIGDNLPYLVPFMTDTYSPQAVNQARHAFRDKVRKSGATFLYGAMCGFFTAEELDELMYEVSEIAKFLLEVEGVDLAVAEELGAEERISSVMREVREASSELRAEDLSQASDD